MKNEMPFTFEVPITVFEKASAEEGKQRRIGGIISTESPDRHGEVVLQEGLDFGEFLANGWFNDNHSKETDGIVGYPESVQRYKKGERLPSGDIARVNGTWAEGYLLDTNRADRLWELGQALQKTKRRLGFSVEGGIQKRQGRLRKTIAKAKVRNVAVTNCPVNTDSRLNILAKSLQAVSQCEDSQWQKALTVGDASGPTPPADTAMPGEGAGQILAEESLARKRRPKPHSLLPDDADVSANKKEEDEKDKKKDLKKGLSDGEAIEWVLSQRPDMSIDQAARLVRITKERKNRC